LTARRIVACACTIASALLPIAAQAQHGSDTKAPATVTAKAGSETVTSTADSTGKGAPSAAAPKKEPVHATLKSALERLNQRIKEELDTPQTGRTAQTGQTARTGQTRQTEQTAPIPARAPTPGPPVASARIRLRWRLNLTWPAALDDQAAPANEDRIALAWH
jgi:hypothetical protein